MRIVGFQEERFGGDGEQRGCCWRGFRRGFRQFGSARLCGTAHIRQDMRNAFMAIDTGFALLDGHRVLNTGFRTLGGDIHGIEAMARTAGG
ncbi:hypothetical protein D3C78_1597950 [compost metagenome]